jgi:ribonucleoside-diphosphate reductase alpha chain
MSAQDHIAMMEAVQPFVDTAISKTVNIPADYPYEDFKDLYLQAWRARLKGPGHLPAQQHPGLGAGNACSLHQRLPCPRPTPESRRPWTRCAP